MNYFALFEFQLRLFQANPMIKLKNRYHFNVNYSNEPSIVYQQNITQNETVTNEKNSKIVEYR